MITRIITDRDDCNRVVVNHYYPATGDMACTVQRVDEEGNVTWEESDIVFTSDMIQLTDEELAELSGNSYNQESYINEGENA